MREVRLSKRLLSSAAALVARETAAAKNRPLAATIELTYQCNLCCRMCRVPQKAREQTADELTTAEVIAVVDELYDLGVGEIALLGAEPLLRKDIAQIIEAIARHNMICIVTTNGTLLSNRMVSVLLDTGLQTINISIDDPSATHDYIRGRQVLGTLVEAIAFMVQARATRGHKRPWINVHCTVSALNIKNLAAMIPFCERLGVDSLSVQYLTETTAEQVQGAIFRGKVVASERFIPSGPSLRVQPDQVTELERGLAALRSYQGRLTVSHRALTSLSTDVLLRGSFPVRRCYWLRSHIIVDPYGGVYPCANIDRYIYGNTREESLTDIWYGERAQAIRKHIKRDWFPVCEACCHFSNNWTLSQIARYLLTKSI